MNLQYNYNEKSIFLEGYIVKITFIGADHEVTGSLHLVETDDIKLIVDCGMQQGKDVYENAPLPVNYSDIDYILLTHAHIDHAGMIPYAYVNGFNGTVLTTEASLQLDKIMLLDSAAIQEKDAEASTKKNKRVGKEAVEALYTTEDAMTVMKLFHAVKYGQMVELSDCVKVRFTDAGHLLGSASVEMWITEGNVEKKVVFSGDIGNKNKPLIKDPQYIKDADCVIMESTYGDRKHEDFSDHIEDIARVIQETLDRRGNIVFPAFAVGRTQELLFLIREIKEKNLVKGHDGFQVYVDSPLAVEATKVFATDFLDCYDEETRQIVSQGINPIIFDGLELSVSTEDSKAINEDPVPKIIIAAAGMCNAGRIKYHLKYNLWREESTVVFAGYQAEGTLGRQIQDGADSVKIFGEPVVVRAHIETIPGMSSHADQDGLMEWIGAYEKKPERVILVHGDDDAMKELQGRIENELGLTVSCPFSGSVYNIASNEFEYEAQGVPVVKHTENQIRNDIHRDNLDSALKSLTELVARYKSGANKDMDAFAEEILKLVEANKF